MVQIWTLARSPGQPPVWWLEVQLSSSLQQTSSCLLQKEQTRGWPLWQRSPYNQPAGLTLLTAGDVGSRPLRQKGFWSLYNSCAAGQSGVTWGTLFCTVMPARGCLWIGSRRQVWQGEYLDVGLKKCQAAQSCEVRDGSVHATGKQAAAGLAHMKASCAIRDVYMFSSWIQLSDCS